MVKDQTKVQGEEVEKKSSDWSEPKNQGKLILDATCTRADLKYPTDLGLLNQAREHTEKIIDSLHNQTFITRKKKANHLSKQSQKRIPNHSKTKKATTKSKKKSH